MSIPAITDNFPTKMCKLLHDLYSCIADWAQYGQFIVDKIKKKKQHNQAIRTLMKPGYLDKKYDQKFKQIKV